MTVHRSGLTGGIASEKSTVDYLPVLVRYVLDVTRRPARATTAAPNHADVIDPLDEA